MKHLINFRAFDKSDLGNLNKIFAAIMTVMVAATVIAGFVLGALSLSGGSATEAPELGNVTETYDQTTVLLS